MRVVTFIVCIGLCILLVAVSYYLWCRDTSSAETIVIADPGPGLRAGVRGGQPRPAGPWGRLFAQMARGNGSVTPAWLRGRDGLDETVAALEDLNLTPAFDLTPQQKEKIQALRLSADAAQAKWQKDHAAEIRKLEEAVRTARTRDELQALSAKCQAFVARSPRGAAVQQVKAALTPAQSKALQERMAQMAAGAEAASRQDDLLQ